MRIWIFFFLFLLLPSGDAWAAATTLVLQPGFLSTSFKMKVVEEFVRLVGEKTNGQVNIGVLPPFGIPSDRGTLGLVKFGKVDIAVVRGALSGELGLFSIVELPYLIRSHKHMAEFAETVVMPYMAPKTAEDGVLLLGVLGGEFRNIISRKPIRTAIDFRDLELSVPGSVIRGEISQDNNSSPTVELFNKLGAKAISIPSREAGGAAQDFYVDAVDSTLLEILEAHSYGSLRYLTLTEHSYTPFYLVINLERFRALDHDIQEALQAAARDAQVFAFQTSDEDDRMALEALRDRGVEIIEWAPSERLTLENISRPLYDQFSFQVLGGQDYLSKALRLSPRF
jgi:TRAP-type transport system periplasmic protein